MAQSANPKPFTKRMSTTIEDILTKFDVNSLSSPRKMSTQILKCAVLTKSSLRDTRRGKMFSMTLCDYNAEVTIRAICFKEDQYQAFDLATTYDIQDFKLKKGFGDNHVEILIASDTKVTKSLFQFALNEVWFKINQIQRNETENVKHINTKAKVIAISDVQAVGQFPHILDKREVQLADETGEITLVLCRERASSVSFKEEDVLKIENASTNVFNHVRQLTLHADSFVTVIDEDIGVVPQATSNKKRTYLNTVNTNINAYKNFKCIARCFNCKTLIEVNKTQFKATTKDNFVIHCSACSTTFLSMASKIYNECQLNLAVNNQWYTANSRVIQHIFQWVDPVVAEPSQNEVFSLLQTKFTVRLDMERKIIEHAEIISAAAGPEQIYEVAAKSSKLFENTDNRRDDSDVQFPAMEMPTQKPKAD